MIYRSTQLILIFLIIPFYNLQAAEVIEFPEDELALESVLPVFKNREAVKNRNVPLSNRFEVGLGGGLSLREALYDPKNFGISLGYHFDEVQAVNLRLVSLIEGLSDKGDALAAGRGLSGGTFNADLAPRQELFAILSYTANAYYGKISLTKQTVMNMSVYGLAGAQIVRFTDKSTFGLNFGFGQKLYFSKNWGLDLNLLFLLYQGPDPTSMPQNNTLELSSDDLEETTFLTSLFNLGLIYLF